MEQRNDECDPLRLAELLCARLCHDLSGPIGAIANGAELLSDEPAGTAPSAEVMALLADSALTAGVRLRFLRTALGGGRAMLSHAELRAMTQSLFETGDASIALDWPDPGTPPFSPELARLLLNLLLLARESLPRGGQVKVHSARDPASLPMMVTAAGTGARPGPAANALASESLDGLDARAVQGYLAARLAEKLACTVRLDASEGSVCFTLHRL